MTESSDAERDRITAFDGERAWVTGGYLIERLITQRLEATGKEPSQNELAELFYPGNTHKTGREHVKRLRAGNYPLTTGELVHLIARFQAYNHQQIGDRLTPEEILILLQKLTQLKPEEKQQLNLSIDLEALMLQQAILNVNLYQSQSDHETVLSLYKSSVGLAFNQDISSHFRGIRDLHAYIKNLVTQGVEGDRLPSYLPPDLPGEQQKELIRKAQREIDRILLKCGLGQFQFQVPTVNQQAQSAYIKQYLPPRFVQRLTQAVIENELLTDNFPIFIKTITVQKLGPFPLEVASTLQDQGSGLILGDLLRSGVTNTEISSQISSQHANRVTVYFYMRLPQHYKPQLPAIFEQLKTSDEKGSRIEFSLSSTGIGGTLSHVVKVINTILLADNESLKNEFFPIAHEILITQDIIQNNMPSPVWAHSLVKLCNIKTLALAMNQSQASGKLRLYEEFAFGGQVGRGDYCGFDLLLCSANAALQARLRALHLTGIAPQKYLKALGHRIERLYLIKEARSYVESYPFSSVALESRLRTDLIKISTQQTPLERHSPYSLFDAYISIIETHLDEGAYRRANQYLTQLYPSLDSLSENGLNWFRWFGNNQQEERNFDIFSGSFIIRFELCKAQYFYLIDCDQERASDRPVFLPNSTPLDPGVLVARAWEALNRAEQHLSVRLAKYLIINEVSQGIFHPHHHHLARIYFLRAKLLIFFPRQVPVESSGSPHFLPTDVNSGNQRDRLSAIHGGRLFLMEQARIYAASNGDEEQYACYTACQAWIYLMAAFAADPSLTIQLPIPKSSLRLTRAIGLAWAKRLRNHALISYADTGQRCYYQIKENSGLSDQLHPLFGNYQISPIPPIREILGKVNLGQQESDGVLSLDMSLLSVERRWCGSSHMDQASRKIYLFGTNACYLFFARGLFHLCSDELTTGSNEFEQCVATPTIALWQQKFYLSSRLLNLSWAIADDGGQMQAADDGNYNIDRNFMSDPDLGEAIDPDVSSVRDLYPHRVTEIADLGRIFAAAALVLQLYTADTAQVESLGQRFAWITDDFQSLKRCQRPLTRESLRGQTRYNGHLTSYIRACHQLLLREFQLALSQRSPDDITVSAVRNHRDRLIQQLFAALVDIP